MGKFKRIPVKDINAMRKILDELPDKNLGKTREEAAELLNTNILKAIEKGYTVKELAEIMARATWPFPRPSSGQRCFPKRRRRESVSRSPGLKP